MSSQLEILCCPLTAIDDRLLASYRSLLSDDEHQRLAGYRAPAAAKEFIVGRALLRTALSQRLQCDASTLVFERNVDGKPQLALPENNGWHFNLSHARQWVVLIVSDAGPVGIDVEDHTRRNNLSAIANRFFSPQENAQLARCAEAQWLDNFFAIWTLKEAHAKARGCGLAKILACSSIALDWTNARIDFDLRAIARSDMPLSSWLYRLDSGISLAAIASSKTFLSEPPLIQVIPLSIAQPLPITAAARGNWQP